LKHFYGLSEYELDNLDAHRWSSYVQCIGKIAAMEKMRMIVATMFPNLKTRSRSKILRELQKEAHVSGKERKLSLQEAFSKLGGMLNGK